MYNTKDSSERKQRIRNPYFETGELGHTAWAASPMRQILDLCQDGRLLISKILAFAQIVVLSINSRQGNINFRSLNNSRAMSLISEVSLISSGVYSLGMTQFVHHIMPYYIVSVHFGRRFGGEVEGGTRRDSYSIRGRTETEEGIFAEEEVHCFLLVYRNGRRDIFLHNETASAV